MKYFTISEFSDQLRDLQSESFVFTNRKVKGSPGQKVSMTIADVVPDIIVHFDSIKVCTSPFDPSIKLYNKSDEEYAVIIRCVTRLIYDGSCTFGHIFRVEGYIGNSNCCGIIGTILIE